ncbi:MAG: alpha/beta fold hydrolase [Gammaproteobacteria bacterium]|nr:alpha/beta fold hydrolase [Gammaproteobacteria bacterium]
MSIFKEIKGMGEDVIVIHGWGCNHLDMHPVVEQLAKHYRVTNIDLPGVGSSDWDLDTDTIYDIAEQVLPDLPERAIYVGWSFGGLVSMAIAARHPECVKRFIGIGTTPKLIAAENWLGFPQPGFAVAFDSVRKHGLKALLTEDYATEFAKISPKPSQFNVLNHFLAQSPEIPQEILFKGIEICDSTDLRKEFAAMQCPIDLIMGEEDVKVLFASATQLQALNPKIKIHNIAEARHMPFWTHPEKFNHILKEILKS